MRLVERRTGTERCRLLRISRAGCAVLSTYRSFARTGEHRFVPPEFAPNDFTSSLAYAIGFRDWAYRQRAVDALRLSKGDRVVEIGCGTGRKCLRMVRSNGHHTPGELTRSVLLPVVGSASNVATSS